MSRQITAENNGICGMRKRAYKCFISQGKTVERCSACTQNSLCAAFVKLFQSKHSKEDIEKMIGVNDG